MSESYAVLKESLAHTLAGLARLAETRLDDAVAGAATTLGKKLADERFNVVVVGEFKRGKTTLINALLGEDVLPTGVVPLTSIVTVLAWGTEPRAEVTFADGRVEQVDVGELGAFVTERGNPGNRLGVERALVLYPCEYLADGVTLVDTPGVGSVYAHNTTAALDFVPQADAAIFVTSSDPPISIHEREFLEDVREEAARMFFVLNKIDYLADRDRDESVAFTRTVLREALGRDVDVFAVSSRDALTAKLTGSPTDGSGLARFENAFREFLLRERGATILESVAGSTRKLIADERNSLEVQEAAARMTAEDLRRVARSVEEVFAQARLRRDDASLLLRRAVDRVVGTVEDDLAALRAEQTPMLLAEAERFLGESGDPGETLRGVDDHVKQHLRRAIDRWRIAEDRAVEEHYRDAVTRFVEEADGLVERTVDLCSDLIGVELERASSPTDLATTTRFSYAFFEVPTILESILPDVGGILPDRWNRKRALKRVREETPLLVDKQCGRLRWDYAQRLEASRANLQRTLDERLEATIESLRLGLDRAESERARGAEEESATATSARAVRAELDALDGELTDIAGRAVRLAPPQGVGLRA